MSQALPSSLMIPTGASLAARVVDALGDERREDLPGRDAVHANVASAQLRRQRHGQSDDRRLAGGVRGRTGG